MAPFLRLAEHKSDARDIRRAKKLRKEAPLAERLLWEPLRAAAKEEGLRFRRQHAFHPYILDLVCLKSRLVIEIDGPSHDLCRAHDKEREDYLKKHGYEIMRFTNEDVRMNLENVVQMIIARALELTAVVYTPLP
ncbi:MAG: endonuclease domain-containing protein [Alphaproteobacteria bacterium]|nr:endonuclease domain-containing protein [Alphaproteobacteria bacterium]